MMTNSQVLLIVLWVFFHKWKEMLNAKFNNQFEIVENNSLQVTDPWNSSYGLFLYHGLQTFSIKGHVVNILL